MQPNRFNQILDVFLSSTDQKRKTFEAIEKLLLQEKLNTKTFVDLGFGDGLITSEIGKHFERTVAIETDVELVRQYRNNSTLSNVEIIHGQLQDQDFTFPADFILLSYVIGYVKSPDSSRNNTQFRLELFEHLNKQLAPNGIIATVNSSFSGNYEMLFQDMGLPLSSELAEFDKIRTETYETKDVSFPVTLKCNTIDELVTCFRLMTYQTGVTNSCLMERFYKHAKKFESNEGFLFHYESSISYNRN